MTRTARFRRTCNILAGLLILAALVRLALALVPLADPLLTCPATGCEGCSFERDPVLLLEPEEARKMAWQTPGTEQQILEHLGQRKVRLMLFLAEVARAVPFFALFLFLALALRSFAASGFNPVAVRWLRWSALASVVWVFAQPVARSIRWTAFSPITHKKDLTHLVVEVNDLLWPMLLSFAVWICAWALEEAATLQQDLEEYV